MTGSVRDYAILWLNGRQASGSGTAQGGNVILNSGAHHLDGPEHLATSDNTDLDATTSAHGLLPKLSGSVGDALRGDGTFGGLDHGGLSGLGDDDHPQYTTDAEVNALIAAVIGSGTGWFNVQDYGAVGDGTTDDTTAIEDTFDAADAIGGGVIYFPATSAYYKITSLITRTSISKYHLLGAGTRYGPARVHQATSNTGAFKFAPTSGTPFNDRVLAAIIENLTVSGPGSASSGRGIESTNDVHIKDCFVYGFYDGIYIGGSSFYSQVLHTTLTDCDNAGIVGSGVNNLLIDGCRLTGLFSPGGSPIGTLANGIVIVSGSAYRIVNCSIEYFTQYGISIDGTSASVIEGNYFETQSGITGFAHVYIGGTAHTYATWVIGNYFQGDGLSGFNAIKLGNAHKFHIHANRFGVNAAIGIANAGVADTGFVWGNENTPAGTFNLPSDTITSPGGMTNPMTTAGDLIKGGIAGAPARVAIGSSGQILRTVTGAPAWSNDDQLNGVTVSGSPTTGQALVATGTTAAHWAAIAAALDDLTDVVITSPVTLQTLVYDGTEWINTSAIWRPLMDGAGAVIVDGATGEAIMALS